MVVAYVMVKANTGNADQLRTEIDAIDGVEETHIVAGDVDLIAKLVVETTGEVKDISAGAVQEIAGVEDTRTYIAMD